MTVAVWTDFKTLPGPGGRGALCGFDTYSRLIGLCSVESRHARSLRTTWWKGYGLVATLPRGPRGNVVYRKERIIIGSFEV